MLLGTPPLDPCLAPTACQPACLPTPTFAAAMRQVRMLRQHFMRAALAQEVAYYDTEATAGEP